MKDSQATPIFLACLVAACVGVMLVFSNAGIDIAGYDGGRVCGSIVIIISMFTFGYAAGMTDQRRKAAGPA